MSQKMHINSRSHKFLRVNLNTLAAAVISAVLFSSAHAAGLGKLTVLSSLGQPLHAEIELTSVSKEEAGALTVKLASTEAFRQANIEFNPVLFTLRFAIEQRAGKQKIRVTSTQPVNEPFVDILLELGGSNNRLVREYTFLLDPADLRKGQPVQVAVPAARTPPLAAPASQPTAPSAPVTEPVPEPELASSQDPQPAPPSKGEFVPRPAPPENAVAPVEKPPVIAQDATTAEHAVKRGETLGKIARQVRQEGVSLDQMLVALQRANPHAFIGNNMNRLRVGQILSVPDAQTAGSVKNSEARALVVAQAADFSRYQNKLAAHVADAAPQESEESKQSATGKIVAKVEENPTAATESKDKLKLSKSGAAVAMAAGTAAKGSKVAAADAEDKIAKEKALAEANARVKELEKNVGDLQKLLEFKNKDLADKQKQIDLAAKAAAKAEAAALASPPAAAAPVVPAAEIPAPATPAAATPATSTTEAPAVSAATEATADASAAASAASVPVDTAPVPVKPKAVKPPPPPETSLLDDLLGNTLVLSLIALVLAGLGGFGVYSARRKKQQRDFQDSNILTDSSLKANSLFGSTGGQSVDTNNSVFNSNFAPSASQLDTNEVDPVAEADVYIAYGRDAQAEEILKEALRTQPERNAVRVKLLEIYANRKDTRAFEMLASELYSLTKGEGEDWQQATSLGIALDPKNPLYAGGKPSDAAIAKAATLTAPTQPLEELYLDALLNTTQAPNPSLENLDTVEPESAASFGGTMRAPEVGRAEHPPGPAIKNPEPVAASPRAAASVPPPAAPPAPAADPSHTLTGLDFDFDLAGLGIKEAVLPAAMASAPSAETESAADAMNFEFHQDAPPVPEIQQNSAAPSPAAAPFDLDIAFDDLSAPTIEVEPAPATASAPAAMEFDLSGISLDLNPADSQPAVAQDPQFAQESGGGDQRSNVAEMATKLDLALAYQEIGDKEGARELLDEVVKGGDGEQTEKAKSMLQKLA
jgi:pilus assembly protein FimV